MIGFEGLRVGVCGVNQALSDLDFGISSVLQSRVPDARRNKLPCGGFGFFPKISTPVENPVEKRVGTVIPP